jgi:hypothetical protein
MHCFCFQGVKVKMDDQGNILVKRVSKSNVYVKSTSTGDETSIGNDVLKQPNCALELEKPVKVRIVCQAFARPARHNTGNKFATATPYNAKQCQNFFFFWRFFLFWGHGLPDLSHFLPIV